MQPEVAGRSGAYPLYCTKGEVLVHQRIKRRVYGTHTRVFCKRRSGRAGEVPAVPAVFHHGAVSDGRRLYRRRRRQDSARPQGDGHRGGSAAGGGAPSCRGAGGGAARQCVRCGGTAAVVPAAAQAAGEGGRPAPLLRLDGGLQRLCRAGPFRGDQSGAGSAAGGMADRL